MGYLVAEGEKYGDFLFIPHVCHFLLLSSTLLLKA